MDELERLREGAAVDRQDAASVREAARVCLEHEALPFALAMMAIAVRRTGARPGDWAVSVRALLDAELAERLEDAEGLAELCLRAARAEAPGDPEIEALGARLAGQRGGRALPYRAPPELTGDITPHLFEALESVPAEPAHAFVDLPPETQDVVVAELCDEAAPALAPLVASILRVDVGPALHACLLDSVAAWAAHPDVRDAVEELHDSQARALLGDSLGKALRAVQRARKAPALRFKPSEGRSARPGVFPRRALAPAAPGAVFEGVAYRRAGTDLKSVALAAAVFLLLLFFGAWGVWMQRWESGVLLLWAGIGAVLAVIIGYVGWTRALRVRYRVASDADGVHFEVSDGPRSKRVPFPLEYQAALHPTVVYAARRQVELIVLEIAILDEQGRPVLGFQEQLSEVETPPRGWAVAQLELPAEATYVRLLGRIHLDELERALARWCRKTRSAE